MSRKLQYAFAALLIGEVVRMVNFYAGYPVNHAIWALIGFGIIYTTMQYEMQYNKYYVVAFFVNFGIILNRVTVTKYILPLLYYYSTFEGLALIAPISYVVLAFIVLTAILLGIRRGFKFERKLPQQIVTFTSIAFLLAHTVLVTVNAFNQYKLMNRIEFNVPAYESMNLWANIFIILFYVLAFIKVTILDVREELPFDRTYTDVHEVEAYNRKHK